MPAGQVVGVPSRYGQAPVVAHYKGEQKAQPRPDPECSGDVTPRGLSPMMEASMPVGGCR